MKKKKRNLSPSYDGHSINDSIQRKNTRELNVKKNASKLPNLSNIGS